MKSTNNGKAKVESVYDKIKDLREVPLEKCDFSALRERYGARKYGAHFDRAYSETGVLTVRPSYRFAAQIDLDHFHSGEDCILDWDQLIDEMFPEPDDRTPEERVNDQLAMTYDKG